MANTTFDDALAELAPSPVVELNRAVAVSMAFGPQAALELVDGLSSDQFAQGLPSPAQRARRLPEPAQSLRASRERWQVSREQRE